MNIKLKLISISVSAVLLSGCATYYFPAPVDEYSSGMVSHVQITNAQMDTKPRMFFYDGITTNTTNYKEWSDVLISKVHQEITLLSPNESSTKSLNLSIGSITCAGHFAAHCEVTALVEIDSDRRKLITSDKVIGYPSMSALNNALGDTAKKIVTDKEVSDYLLN